MEHFTTTRGSPINAAVLTIPKANDARHDEVRLAQGDAVHVWWWGSDVVVLTQ